MNHFRKLLKNKTLLGVILVIILWEILSLIIKSNVIPSPYDAIYRFVSIFGSVISYHMIASILRVIIAVTASLIVGIPLGLWMGMYKRIDDILSPIVYILYPLPKVAFLPVFMIILGIGDLSKIFLIFTVIVFQIMISVRDGIKEIPTELFYSVNSLGLSRFEVYRHLILPSITGKLITSLRISIGISISALFFAENFATSYGIGYFIMNSWIMVDYLDMFSGIIALSLIGLVMLGILDLIESKLCPWIKINNSTN